MNRRTVTVELSDNALYSIRDALQRSVNSWSMAPLYYDEAQNAVQRGIDEMVRDVEREDKVHALMVAEMTGSLRGSFDSGLTLLNNLQSAGWDLVRKEST
jgi:hypothetical protein